MRCMAVVAVSLSCVAFVQPLRADIPGTTLSEVTNLSAPVYPRNLAVGADGKVWFSDDRFEPHSIGFFTPDGQVTKFPVPCDQCNAAGDRLANVQAITVGPDGNAWFAYSYVNRDGMSLNGGMNNFIGRVTPAGQFTSFAIPTLDAFVEGVRLQGPGQPAITSGPDGNLWFTEPFPGKIGKISTAGVLTEYPLPSNKAVPSIITKGQDGNLWFTETSAGKIGRISTAGAITEFTAPKGGPYNSASPFGITAGADGNLWYTDLSGAIGRVSPAGVVTRFEILEGGVVPQNPSIMRFITSGQDGKLYFGYQVFIPPPVGGGSSHYEGRLAQLDPSSVSASGRIVALAGGLTPPNFSKLPDGLSPEDLAPYLPAALYVVFQRYDEAAKKYIGKCWALKSTVAATNCDPPILLDGKPSPITVRLEIKTESDFSLGTSVHVTGVKEPSLVFLSGNVPSGVQGQTNEFGFVWIRGGTLKEGTYEFALTITDDRRPPCTATVNYIVVVRDRFDWPAVGLEEESIWGFAVPKRTP